MLEGKANIVISKTMCGYVGRGRFEMFMVIREFGGKEVSWCHTFGVCLIDGEG